MSEPIVVASWWVNHPEMLDIHKKMWETTFIDDKVRYIVYIDCPSEACQTNFGDTTMRTQLANECIRLGIEYIEIPEQLHLNRTTVLPNTQCRANPVCCSCRDCVVTQFAWNRHILEEGVKRYCMVQPDIFPYRQVKWNEITQEKAFMYKPQIRGPLRYAWNGLCCVNRLKWDEFLLQSISFDLGNYNGNQTDSGGGTWKTLAMMPEEDKLEWGGLNSLQWTDDSGFPVLPLWASEHIRKDPRNEVRDGKTWYYSEIQHDWCLHLRAGCNWDGAGVELHKQRYARFTKLLQDAIQSNTQFL